ncbi:hypothetical protein TNCV_1681121 [Trichonephila clavipes]|nr:hypothetical protein TNCV_1681121 [Trichonephila clavipes]
MDSKPHNQPLGIKVLSAKSVYTRPAELVCLVPRTCILIFPKEDFLHCAALFKTSPKALEYNNMTWAVLLRNLLILEKWRRNFKGCNHPYVIHILDSAQAHISRHIRSYLPHPLRTRRYGIGCSGGSFKNRKHAADEEDAIEVDKLLEVVGVVSITEIGG